MKKGDFGEHFEVEGNVFVKSHTFMNLSGNSLASLESERPCSDLRRQLVVVCDELDAKTGDAKVRLEGSAR